MTAGMLSCFSEIKTHGEILVLSLLIHLFGLTKNWKFSMKCIRIIKKWKSFKLGLKSILFEKLVKLDAILA